MTEQATAAIRHLPDSCKPPTPADSAARAAAVAEQIAAARAAVVGEMTETRIDLGNALTDIAATLVPPTAAEQRCADLTAEVRWELVRTDTKTAALLALATAVLAATAGALATIDLPLWAAIAAGVGGSATGLAVLRLLLAVRPRTVRLLWTRMANTAGPAVADLLATLHPDEPYVQLRNLSAVLLDKQTAIRHATNCLITALAAFTLAAILTATGL
ncbi:hypothetical protein [Allonocardiopsis opalescens]|uniref:Pycsar effector protein domain-containing protein n=1 Tax=Allonocardiopsis opalescens TaxID=1144618 RepID=A0A2T0Q990_9ACTN|nr:hypothetical protein [Allonocardiopsis opalescens]PRY00424.1 hypothetical protein CLV72_10253 [Allonocardiopsis opalescens]